MKSEEIITSISELYGVKKEVPENSILLLTTAELLAITDILRDLATAADHEPRYILRKIDELEKPFKKQLNSKKSK